MKDLINDFVMVGCGGVKIHMPGNTGLRIAPSKGSLSRCMDDLSMMQEEFVVEEFVGFDPSYIYNDDGEPEEVPFSHEEEFCGQFYSRCISMDTTEEVGQTLLDLARD